MTIKVAINGFGRIGRNILRGIVESGRTDITVVAINDLAPVDTNAHLFEFDSVHGRFRGDITTTDTTMDVGTGPIRVTALRDPADLPWSDVDVVLECTGIFRSRADCQAHLDNGSSRVLISAPGKDVDRTIVQGVNDHELTAQDIVVSNASCTTNCLAPVVKVLNDSFGIKRGFMTTVHAYTGDQPTLDRAHKDLARGRAAAMSMVPTSTGAARALGVVMPEIGSRIDGVAIRVPTPNVSCVDLVVETTRDTTIDAVNAAMRAAADGPMRGILDVSDKKLVSVDLNHDPHSSIFMTGETRIQDGSMVRILTWYDNEWGYCQRMIDTAVQMGTLI